MASAQNLQYFVSLFRCSTTFKAFQLVIVIKILNEWRMNNLFTLLHEENDFLAPEGYRTRNFLKTGETL